MNKVENLSISSIIFGVFVISLVVFMTITFESPSKDINSYYQVYLGGERIGLLKDVDGLYDLIDKEQEQIKKEYNVTKVYPPLGLEIQKVLTYKDDLMTPRQIYDEIKDIEPFTIEGYEVSINNDGNIKKFNILNKDDLDIAIRNTVISFVDEKDYDNYLNGIQSELRASRINLLIDDTLEHPMRVEAKIRYRHAPAVATVFRSGDDELTLRFDEPQRAIARGQSLVLYRGDRVLGGAIID